MFDHLMCGRNGLLGSLAGALLVSTIASAAADPTLVETDKGTIRGVVNGSVVQFLGVPYAAPPVAALRFNSPQPHARWDGVLDATKPAARCPSNQRDMQAPMKEDCLNLGITVPFAVAVPKMPVYVWYHGGGFQNGDASLVDPGAAAMATRNNIIVVTVNYRLGLLGFLGVPALDSGGGSTGNYGLEDQQAALRWVKANIAKFGGDPANVTIGGQSAGGRSVCQLMASPLSDGLFVRGIVQSGSCAAVVWSLQEKYSAHEKVPAQLGCGGTPQQVLTCLRSDAFSFQNALKVAAESKVEFRPTVGGPVLPRQPSEALGAYPMLMGLNFSEPIDIICSTMASFELQTSARKAPIYAYEFHDPVSTNVHSAELRYVWTNFNSDSYLPITPNLTGASAFLSDAMIKYWGNFIRSGDPNGGRLPIWAPRVTSSDVMQLVPEKLGVLADLRAEHNCSTN
jgi:para-nitrobenzyl esterase